jgi:CBS domain-containing protein
MIFRRISCLPVVAHGNLVGIITGTDLLGRVVAEMYTPT